LDADYSVIKDSVLYGVVTGAEAEGTGEEGDEVAREATSFAERIIDYPFSFRYRVDGNAFWIKDTQFGGIDAAIKGKGELATLQGRGMKKTETSRDAIKATR
jgi:hypothetical protein